MTSTINDSQKSGEFRQLSSDLSQKSSEPTKKSPEKKSRAKAPVKTKKSAMIVDLISSSENEEIAEKENRDILTKTTSKNRPRRGNVEKAGPSGIKKKKSPVKKSAKRRFCHDTSSDEDYGEPRAKSTQLHTRFRKLKINKTFLRLKLERSYLYIGF